MLLQAGADPNVGVPRTFRSRGAETLLGLAWGERQSEQLIWALLQHGADPDARHVIDPEFPEETAGPAETDNPEKPVVKDGSFSNNFLKLFKTKQKKQQKVSPCNNKYE